MFALISAESSSQSPSNNFIPITQFPRLSIFSPSVHQLLLANSPIKNGSRLADVSAVSEAAGDLDEVAKQTSLNGNSRSERNY